MIWMRVIIIFSQVNNDPFGSPNSINKNTDPIYNNHYIIKKLMVSSVIEQSFITSWSVMP